MSTKQDAERRFAQIEGERDYYKRMAERRGEECVSLKEALCRIAAFVSDGEKAKEIARAALEEVGDE